MGYEQNFLWLLSAFLSVYRAFIKSHSVILLIDSFAMSLRRTFYTRCLFVFILLAYEILVERTEQERFIRRNDYH